MISKEEKELISYFSKKVKKSILDLVEENDFLEDYIDPQSYCGACGIASLALYSKLKKEKFNCDWVYGYHEVQEYRFGERHCWIEYKNKIVDVTYKQISPTSNHIYVSPARYYKLKENPTHRVFNKYWKWQNPFKYNYFWNSDSLEIFIKRKGD